MEIYYLGSLGWKDKGRELTLRPATAADMKFVFNLRNLPDSIKTSTSHKAINWIDHIVWYPKALDSNDIRLYVISSLNGEEVGTIRLDRCEDKAIISIYLHETARGKGIGLVAIHSACREAFKIEDWKIKKVIAYVRRVNKQSIKAFSKAGFYQQFSFDCPDKWHVCMVAI